MEINWDKSPILDSNLADVAHSLGKYNQDWFHVGAGDNGSGKSTFGMYCCTKVDPTFNIDRIVFTLSQLKQQIKAVKPTQAIMCDEFGDIMFSRDWNTKESRELAKYMMIMRYRRNFIWMNIPKLEYADIYVRQGRLSSLTFTYTVPREGRDEKGKIRIFPKLGYFYGYSKFAVMRYFEKHYSLNPSWDKEKFPNLKEMGDEWRHFVELYEAKKDRFGEMKTDNLMEKEAVKDAKGQGA